MQLLHCKYVPLYIKKLFFCMLFVHLDIIKDNKKRKSESFFMCFCLATCTERKKKEKQQQYCASFYWIQLLITGAHGGWSTLMVAHPHVLSVYLALTKWQIMDDLCTHTSKEVPRNCSFICADMVTVRRWRLHPKKSKPSYTQKSTHMAGLERYIQ